MAELPDFLKEKSPIKAGSADLKIRVILGAGPGQAYDRGEPVNFWYAFIKCPLWEGAHLWECKHQHPTSDDASRCALNQFLETRKGEKK